jgi:type IV pilus assembly protein PilV
MTRPPASLQKKPGRQRGASLIEVLVAILILSIGLLGLASMQLRAMRGAVSSVQRTQAVILSHYILDLMRVDRVAASNLLYNTPGGLGQPLCAAPQALPGNFSQTEFSAWFARVKTQIGKPADATTCAAIVCNAQSVCTVQLQWDDSASGGLPNQSLVITTQL